MKKQILLPGDEVKITSASNLVVVTYAVRAKLKLKDFIQLYKEYRLMHKRSHLLNEVIELKKRLSELEGYEKTVSNGAEIV